MKKVNKGENVMGKTVPSMDAWLAEAKKAPDADKVGMYLVHNGIVRKTAKAKVRQGEENAPDVVRLFFDSDQEKVDAAIREAEKMEGIYTSCVSSYTLDECPMAYKSVNDIVGFIEDTADVEKIIKPVFNYKG